MSLRDDFAGFDPVLETQRAHDNAGSNHWDGKTLAPWTASRASLCDLLGCGITTDLSKYAAACKTETYPGLLQDIIIFLWVLTRTKEQVIEAAKLGDRAKDQLFDGIYQWAEDNNIDRGTSKFNEGYLLIAKTVTEHYFSRFVADKKSSSKGKKKGLAPRGNSGLHHALPVPAATAQTTC